jgi:thymidylate synthase (FAD)
MSIPQENKKVLDHGFIRLIDFMGSDLSIVRNARVSYDAEWRAGENEKSDTRLIRYLAANGHNTPFESCTVTFEVKAPIFVFRQWHRHRTQSYNELSARYKELPREYYVPDLDQITTQSEDNKQMRTDEQHPEAKFIQDLINNANNTAFERYQSLIDLGCPRELARSVLPVGTYSHMFATANLHNWYRFLKERLHPHAQHEIRVYAEAILSVLAELYPVATAAHFGKPTD